MKKILDNDLLLLIARVIPAAVFIFAGIEKIADPKSFAGAILEYKLFPLVIVNISAIILPWIELVAGILLLFGIRIKENLFITGSLLVFFIIIVSVSLLRGLIIDCGCFGTHNAQSAGVLKIVENIFLLLLCLWVYISGGGRYSLK